ncbi:xylosyl- and glucuronyltransferase LARGE2s-like [Halichondria panicea]|uniref:xylosyl- and glucuronyltransferase LARGE2s-like n=1 Tax=Halichondria panicea TaxID=6063 RepID=UPI00312B4BA3
MMLIRKRVVLLLVVIAMGVIALLVSSQVHLVLGKKVKWLENENQFLIKELQQFTTSSQQQNIHRQRKLYKLSEEQFSMTRSSHCETIHIAIVAVGYSTIRSVVILVKSILFYRHNALHFHFVSDDSGKYVLQTLFETWKLPAVDTSFYAAAMAQEKVAWIPNSHYSGVFGLMKLTIPSLLPLSVQKVIVLDTDLMLTSDILSLWRYFEVILAEVKLLGLVENQSDWYFGNLWEGHKPWPALGRGFNTGVMLFNLKQMRAHNWNGLWNTVTTKTLMEYELTALADQDIINAIILEGQNLHYVLPCFWNAQLSEHSLSDNCFNNVNEFKLVHWNSPLKQAVKNKYSSYFESVYEMIKNQNGYQYREVLLNCDQKSEQMKPVAASTDPCIAFRSANKSLLRIHPFIVGYEYERRVHDVTLVTQMSMDRLHMLAPLYAHWNGPISIAVYATDSQVQEVTEHISRVLVNNSKRLALHVVFKTNSQLYPINYLRNVALSKVETSYVFLSDIDFIPMDGAYEYLLEAIKILEKPKRLFVIPAFETHLYRFTYPTNKNEVLNLLQNGSVSTFRSHEWKRGHAPTNYKHWAKTGTPYKIKWVDDYEPYVVVQSNVTKYDERFAGFGWNKVSHMMELNAQGYEFVVLPSVFMIHMPHSPSPDINLFRKSKLYRDCVQVIKTEFKQEIDRQNTGGCKECNL